MQKSNYLRIIFKKILLLFSFELVLMLLGFVHNTDFFLNLIFVTGIVVLFSTLLVFLNRKEKQGRWIGTIALVILIPLFAIFFRWINLEVLDIKNDYIEDIFEPSLHVIILICFLLIDVLVNIFNTLKIKENGGLNGNRYIRIIIKNLSFTASYLLISFLFSYLVYEKVIHEDYLFGFFAIMVCIYTPAYFIVKGNDYDTPWRYIGIGVIISAILNAIVHLALIMEFGDSWDGIEFYILAWVAMSFFGFLFLLDCCVSAIHTFKEKRKKAVKLRSPSENDFPHEVQAD
ncbi:MAG: hypothetical protein E7641_03630 [Ruminococcaceae bacterium]|nr:hypothetical protein [Oscillospiraceae bacterium]